MRGATQCARRVKQLFKSLRSKLGRVQRPVQSDPITQLILGILSRDAPESKARDALERLRSCVVDYNELRVIPVFELAGVLGDYPDARRKAEDLSRALNRIFLHEHAVSLDRLKNAARRDVEAYLKRIDGLEPYTIARIRALGFGQPAVPLDEAMWAYARRLQIVDSRCSLEEAQNFLERQFEPDEALEFFALLRKAAWAEMGAAVRRGEVERILSVPPDRTSRNMLQAIANASSAAVSDEATAEADSARNAAKRERTLTAAGGSSHARRVKLKAPTVPPPRAQNPAAKTKRRAKAAANSTPRAAGRVRRGAVRARSA